MGKCSLLAVAVPKYSTFLLVFFLSTTVFILTEGKNSQT